MKRIKEVPGMPGVTLFDLICSMDNLRLAHENASRGKGWYKEVRMVNEDPDKYLKEIQKMLKNKTYKNSPYEIFYRKEGTKVRKIYKLPYYPDRIIQWAMIQVISPILEKTFINNTYSPIPGKGPLKCMLDVSHAIRTNPENSDYCLKIDIHHYYQSINHDLLKQKYHRLFKDYDLLWLINLIIDSVPDDEGIPIGNYTSQYSGNLFLSEFDHWIKEEKHIKYYYRYMDDMVFLDGDKNVLRDLLTEIKERFDKVEKLEIKQNYQIFPTVVNGIDFVGFVLFPNYVLIRNRIKHNFICLCLSLIHESELSDHNRSTLFSYLGYMQHCNSYNLQMKYYEPLRKKFNLDKYVIKTNYVTTINDDI